MSKVLELAKRFRDDEDGAAMVEYTILLGIISALVIVTVVSVGTWVSGKWTFLDAELAKAPTAPTTPTE